MIEKYIKAGWSCGRIAQEIGRSKNGIVTEVRRGGKENYTACSGQRISDENKLRKKQILSVKNKTNKPAYHMKKRIENLEMQLEILTDMVKELMQCQK